MRNLFPLVLLTVGASVAQADPDPETLYVGAGVTRNSLHNFITQPENTIGFPDISATSWKALFGYRPLRGFAIEADYFATAASENSPNGFNQRSEAKETALYAVGLLPEWEHFDVFLKAGFHHYTLTATGTLTGGPESETGSGFACGGGLQAHIGRFGVRLEYERMFSMGMTDGMQVLSLSAMLNLL